MLRLEQTTPDKLPLPIRLRKETVERWREENEAHKIELTRTIQNEIGYLMVPIFRRTPREDQLYSCNFTSGGIPIAPEKMLDTHIATDLIGDATFDVYDIAADRVGGQRLRAGRRFRAGDAPQARGPRRLRRPHERPARQVPAPHRPRQGSRCSAACSA